MATYRNANWPSDMNAPTAATVRHGAFGLGTRKSAGSITTANRTATSTSGGTPSMPQSITTKLKPQMVATRAASRESRNDMTPSSGAES